MYTGRVSAVCSWPERSVHTPDNENTTREQYTRNKSTRPLSAGIRQEQHCTKWRYINIVWWKMIHEKQPTCMCSRASNNTPPKLDHCLSRTHYNVIGHISSTCIEAMCTQMCCSTLHRTRTCNQITTHVPFWLCSYCLARYLYPGNWKHSIVLHVYHLGHVPCISTTVTYCIHCTEKEPDYFLFQPWLGYTGA